MRLSRGFNAAPGKEKKAIKLVACIYYALAPQCVVNALYDQQNLGPVREREYRFQNSSICSTPNL